MTNLSSCYFCASALESPVQTYELHSHGSDERTTVTLCVTCKEKLGVVLDTVGVDGPTPVGNDETTVAEQTPSGADGDIDLDKSSRAESSSASTGNGPDESDSPTAAASEATSSDDTEQTATEDEPSPSNESGSAKPSVGSDTVEDDSGDELDDGTDDELEAEDGWGDDLAVEDESGETVAESGDELDDGLGEPFEDEELLTDEDPLADEAEAMPDEELEDDEGDPQDGGPLAGGDQQPTGGSGTDESTPVTDSPPKTTESDEPPVDESGESRETGAGDESATAPEARDSETDAGGESQESPKMSISALEYNRVMRMLQNREFPVDRGEITAVATSAYDLSESECTQVIDLAVDRGLLDEHDGQLHRPQD